VTTKPAGKRGRPSNGKAVTRFTITAYFIDGDDDDLKEKVMSVPPGKRWAMMKLLMRSGVSNMPADVNLNDDSSEDLIDL
jgi:hypothetical protein